MWIQISRMAERIAGLFMLSCTRCGCLYGYAGTPKERRKVKFRRERIADICIACYQLQQVADSEARLYKASMERISALEKKLATKGEQ